MCGADGDIKSVNKQECVRILCICIQHVCEYHIFLLLLSRRRKWTAVDVGSIYKPRSSVPKMAIPPPPHHNNINKTT
jgi:hypothetical protein